jgi:hypothetical protein
MDFSSLQIGFVPMKNDLSHPFDLRNFIYYARRRNIKFEIARPDRDYDVIVLSPCADISVWSRYRGRAKIIYFIVDSYLAVSPFNIKGALRGLAKFASGEHKYLRLDYTGAIKDICSRADAVVCTTSEQKKDIETYCGNVHIILEFHSRLVCEVKTDYSIGNRINLAWEGFAENIDGFMHMKEALFKLRKKYPIALHLITDLDRMKHMNKYHRVYTMDYISHIFGNGYFSNTSTGNRSFIYLYQWDLEMLSRIITRCDIAIIPVDIHNPFKLGKPENKLVLFWRMGMPVVVSASPAYERVMAGCGLDLCCHSNDEWVDKIESLILNEAERKSAAMKGKSCADVMYGEDVYLGKWDNLLRSVLDK